MLYSPSISKLFTLHAALLHLQNAGVDVDEALDHLQAEIDECAQHGWVRA